MQIEMFDVGHGHCSVMTAPNGARMMLDCGTRWGADRFWTPSLHYFGQSIPILAPLNLDEDHIADFGSMLKDCRVEVIITNPSIGPLEFVRLKEAGMRAGAEAYLKWLSTPKRVGMPIPDLGQVQLRWYWNTHGGDCKTTNDLSLAVVLQFGHFKILFAGDLEGNGWRGMLKNQQFREELPSVAVFVASHHGRRSGCHDELFKLMKPEIIIISDDEKQYETQETDAWYRQRCHGAPVIGNPSERRYVLTTRNDGSMRINANLEGTWTIRWGVAVKDWPTSPAKPKLNALTDLLADSQILGLS